MELKLKLTLFLALFVFVYEGMAQEHQAVGVNYVGTSTQKRVVPSFASRTNLEAAVLRTTEPNDGRSAKVEVVPGKDPQTTSDYFTENPHITAGSIPTRDLVNDFVVANNVSSPSDPALAVGPNHTFIVYNTGFIIYDKDGNVLQGQTNPNAIFSNGGCCDLTVSYDNLADRWVITYLFVGTGMEIAISDGPDPLTSAWNVYRLPQVSDYNKLSIWRDGYYVTDNGANDVWAIDRDAALSGEPTIGIQGFNVPGVQGQNFTSAQVLNITDNVIPTTGGAPLVYMRDDGFAGVTEDSVNFWTVNVDFDNPVNSNIPAPEVFLVTPFVNVFDGGSFANLPQPNGGDAIDALQSVIMNQAQFRKFPAYNSAIFNFVVNVNPGGDKRAGIRWYEFRQDEDGGLWTMFQEGTYTAPDGKHAWMGSMAMDNQGNIAMGYSVMAGPTTPNPTDHRVGAAYTGRFVSDAPGNMTLAEDVFGISTANINGDRFGDYAKMDVDPLDDQTFWFVTEYRNTNHVAVFKIASEDNIDTGVIAIVQPEDGLLTASETVEVIVRNFGIDAQSNVPVQYTIDGGAPVVEIIAGPIPPASNMTYTFMTTADLSTEGATYIIQACTAMVGDEFTGNDCISKNVKHLEGNNVGVNAIDAPVSGSGLSANEDVTITIENFGVNPQTSIPVFYSVDGGAPVQEVYTGNILSGGIDTYTFTQQVDVSALGSYEFLAGTELVGDADETNDDTSATISNFICRPVSDCEDLNDGVTELQLADQDITTNCGTSPNGYSNETDIIFNFVLNENPFNGVLQTGFQNSVYAIWIDFNDNSDFESDELITTGTTGGTSNTNTPFTVDFSAISTTQTGMHLMRVRGGDENNGDGVVINPCNDLQFGRTNDYTANLTGVLGVGDASFAEANLIIISRPSNQFDLRFNTTTYIDKLPVYIYNASGQILAFYTLENQGNGYAKTIDMSYVSSGIYFVRVGNTNLNKVKRIIIE